MIRYSMGRVLGAWAASFLSAAAPASAAEFDFKDPKGVNSMSFLLDSQVEPIRGFTAGISGKVSFDPDKPEAATGSIAVAADTIQTPNKRMNEVLHSGDWLDVGSHPEVTFEFKRVENAKREGDQFSMTVVGDFTCKGVTKELSIPVGATLLRDRLGDRLNGVSGDLLVLRTRFTIQRSDFDIKRDYGPVVVAEEIQISAQIVGAHRK
jgi:polyisoprenoid-binding protein YceI